MSEIDNVVDECLVEEEILSEEFSKVYTTNDTNEFCCIKNVDGDDFLSTLKNSHKQLKLLPIQSHLKKDLIPKYWFIQIAQEYAVNKIILHNVPDSDYIFSVNGQNVGTFNKITNFPELNDYVLNIKETSLIKRKEIIFRNDESNEDYLNLERIDNTRIVYEKNIFNDDDVVHYSLYGYKYNMVDKTFEKQKQNTKYKYFINTQNMHFNHPTKYITFLAERIDKTKPGNIYFYLEGIMVNNICINGENYRDKIYNCENYECVRINFNELHNFPIKPVGKENNYLTEKINSETLNMSRISKVQFASSNVILYSVDVSYFLTYNMKYMSLLFCDLGSIIF